MKRSCTVTYCAIEWEVEGTYTPGRPAKMYLKNGDPGYPEEPSDLQDVSITIKQGNDESDDLQVVLHVDAIDTIVSRALEIFDEDKGEYFDGEIPW